MLLSTPRLVIVTKSLRLPKSWLHSTVAYSDGSLRRGTVGLGVYVATRPSVHVSVRVPKPAVVDNNYAELLAILVALQVVQADVRAVVRTDSLNSLTMLAKASQNKPIHAKFRGVACDVLHWIHHRRSEPTMLAKVKGHANDRGNCTADALARRASLKLQTASNAHRTPL